ncbi:hypothetical protein B484DRAFT_97823 [Ochromonadaceae sp. CCMP2298]|nr:hypothetical protein B484DRAFT_97823 [Ochromonadaceae sp. CCMP2298]
MIMSQSVCTTHPQDCRQGNQAPWVGGLANSVIFIGAVVGQLSMGFLGDYLSRSKALAVTLMVSAGAAVLSALAPNGSPDAIYSIIIVCRLLIGVGLGGIYPLSATKASEDSAAAPPSAPSNSYYSPAATHSPTSPTSTSLYSSTSTHSPLSSSANLSACTTSAPKIDPNGTNTIDANIITTDTTDTNNTNNNNSPNKSGTNAAGASWSYFWQIPGFVTPWTLAYILADSDLSTSYR